ncbi:MAG TPA: M1 family metallopeptidase [Mycobacteriales bacterium]
MTRFRLAAAAGSLVAALTAGMVAGLAPAASAAPPRPVPGAPGIGDPLFPGLGNGGYDVTHYSIGMTYHADTKLVDAVTTVQARADQALTRFDLDFDGNTIRSVRFDGKPVTFSREGAELIITPRKAIRQNQRFSVTVTYAADPRGAHNCPTPPPLTGTAWFPSDDGFVIAGQPNCSHTVFPSNDHPRDKASYDFTLTAPSDLTAVANGALVKKVSHGATTTWTYRENPPMATELAQIAVGHYTVLTRRGPGGVLLRDVVPTAEAAVVGAKLQNEAEHLRFMTARVGPYPFGQYGVLAAPLVFGFALETQTLSLFPDFVFTGNAPEAGYAPIQVHELAHQWFGDDVSPEKWADVWLNEGHATWYEGTFADVKGFESFEARMRQAYALGDQWRHDFGPVASPPADNLFNNNVYDGGALVLFALRERIGTAAFNRLERAWVRKYAGSTAGTPDFIALASKISGHDQTAFLTDWLFGTTTPPMPGHPDWTVDPVQSSTGLAATTAAPAGVALIRR